MIGQPKFVTVDDFNNYWGMNLRSMLASNDSPSNQAESFLARVEDRLMNWIDNNTFRRIPYEKLLPKQLENFKKAIVTQAMYVYKNGDLGLDSGYDSERGVIVSQKDLNGLEVCQAAINYLSNAGLFNLVMKTRTRYVRGWAGPDGNDLF
jgi:hypothetical protein